MEAPVGDDDGIRDNVREALLGRGGKTLQLLAKGGDGRRVARPGKRRAAKVSRAALSSNASRTSRTFTSATEMPRCGMIRADRRFQPLDGVPDRRQGEADEVGNLALAHELAGLEVPKEQSPLEPS